MLLLSRSSCLLSGPHSWARGRNWAPVPHLPASDIISSGCYRDEGRGVTPPCQQLCFWGPPWMSQVRPFCPDLLHRWESERRNERDEASSWGHILAQMCQHGAELIAGAHWRLSHTASGKRAGVNTEQPGDQREGGLKHLLTSGRMESGAEASPQHLPRRKAVLHSLEDQKRVSSAPVPVWIDLNCGSLIS